MWLVVVARRRACSSVMEVLLFILGHDMEEEMGDGEGKTSGGFCFLLMGVGAG